MRCYPVSTTSTTLQMTTENALKEMTRPAVLQFAFSPRHVTRLERDLQRKLDIERFASS
jgi:hypothetical protein